MTRDELVGKVFRGKSGLVVLAPGVVHALSADVDGAAEFLAVLTPGIVRFEYFGDAAGSRAGRRTGTG
jgi:hypothetical protein